MTDSYSAISRMDTRLTQAQSAQIIAAADRLSRLHETELDKEQVKQILQDLNLSSDFLEDAIAQLQKHQLLTQQKQRHKIVISTITIMIFGLITTLAVVYQKQQNKIARIEALQNIVTRQDSTTSVTQFDRQKDPQVFYRVTLKNVPVNDRLIISCRWSDPKNQTVYQSRNQTQDIPRSPWTTFCAVPLTSQSQTGNWKVQMLIEDRLISAQQFVVK